MESDRVKQFSEVISKEENVSRLKNVMIFIKNIIHEFKVTEQDLIDAGVISKRKARSKDWTEPKQRRS
jgi:hypothetical protein